jgi:hypothetical protein
MKPLTYEEAFPGRFLSAGHLDGKKVTVTIANVYIDPELDKKKPKLVLSFVGKTLELVIPKTNAYCIKEMFGHKLANWVGKRVTLFPTTTLFGEDVVDCIRVWGSPDIAEDKALKVPQGRKKPIPMVMHAMKAAPRVAAGIPLGPGSEIIAKMDPDPTIIEAWSNLGWTREEGHKDMSGFAGTDYLGQLSALIDQANSVEVF